MRQQEAGIELARQIRRKFQALADFRTTCAHQTPAYRLRLCEIAATVTSSVSSISTATPPGTLARMRTEYVIPLVENNFNACELGPRGTSKSHIYKEISPNSILISGGKTSVGATLKHPSTNPSGSSTPNRFQGILAKLARPHIMN